MLYFMDSVVSFVIAIAALSPSSKGKTNMFVLKNMLSLVFYRYLHGA